MRDILYRIKSKKHWVYGLPQKIDKDWVSIDGEMQDGTPCFASGCRRETLCEYTGKLDKNKEKIFENDVVIGNFPYADKGLVVFDEARCGFYIKPLTIMGKASYDKYYKLNSAKLEIIGNIFDNPDLLGNLQ